MTRTPVFLWMLLAFCLVAFDAYSKDDVYLTPISDSSHISNINNRNLCPPLPLALTKTITVSPSESHRLQQIVASAKPGDTVLLQDGIYQLDGQHLWFSTPGVTLRSASGNPDAVILDGSYNTTGLITVAASDVTIAELTLTRAKTHLLHIVSSKAGSTENTQIYRLNIIDPGEQAIKINPQTDGFYVDNGSIACSSIKLTPRGRQKVSTAAGGCYTGGIDAHQARGWTVRDNYFEGFWCQSGLSEHAIHFWRGGRDTMIMRNYLKDNARGIGLGLMNQGHARIYADAACPAVRDYYVGHYNGHITNNFIHTSSIDLFASSDGSDCGICLWSSCNTLVTHNTVVSSQHSFSSIEWRFAGSVNNSIINNLVSHSLKQRNDASAILNGNLENSSLSIFVDGYGGDLHLSPKASSAIDRGVILKNQISNTDFDHEQRDNSPDIGADEYSYF